MVEKCCELGFTFTGSAAGGGARLLLGRKSGTLGICDAESLEVRSSSGGPRFPRLLTFELLRNNVSRLFGVDIILRIEKKGYLIYLLIAGELVFIFR